MRRRNAVLVGAALVLFLGSSALTSPSRGSASAAVTSLAAPAVEQHLAQVRAEFITLDGNDDVTRTTCTIVNRSSSKTVYLGDLFALGPDGLSEVLAVHTALNGVGIPPLGSVDLPVDSATFPGLQPKLHPDSRGLESVVASWSGPKEAVRLSATIRIQTPGDRRTRMERHVDGHLVTK